MKSKKIAKTWVYIVSIAAALAAGGISSVFAMSAMGGVRRAQTAGRLRRLRGFSRLCGQFCSF